MMAGDSAIDWGGVRDSAQKVFRVGGDVLGFAGSQTEGMRFVEWYANKSGDAPALDSAEVIILKHNGCIEYWDSSLTPTRVKKKFTAIGSGASCALGAMHAGATPEQAVKIACKVDTSTGGPVKCLKR